VRELGHSVIKYNKLERKKERGRDGERNFQSHEGRKEGRASVNSTN
jgi:hypothetical protein